MSAFILAKKIGMTQIFADDGAVIPVTVVQAQPNVVTQIKTPEKDGYTAVQVATGTGKHLSKALKGHFRGLGDFKQVREFRDIAPTEKEFKHGDLIDVSAFAPGDIVKITGFSKGKGFAGGVKRHGFSGMPASHGHHHVLRHIGSIGQRFPQHTLKGKKMAGRMGHRRTSVRGLEVVRVDQELHLVALKGAVPGARGTLLEIVKIA